MGRCNSLSSLRSFLSHVSRRHGAKIFSAHCRGASAAQGLPVSRYPTPSWLPWMAGRMAGIAFDCDVLVSYLGAKRSLSCLDLGERGRSPRGRGVDAGCACREVGTTAAGGGGACDPVGPGGAEEGQGLGCWGGGGVEERLGPSLRRELSVSALVLKASVLFPARPRGPSGAGFAWGCQADPTPILSCSIGGGAGGGLGPQERFPPPCPSPRRFLCPLAGLESEVAPLCLTLCDPMDCSPPGSSVHEISQARILERESSSVHV